MKDSESERDEVIEGKKRERWGGGDRENKYSIY